MRFQFWWSEMYTVPLHYHYSKFHSDPEWYTCKGFIFKSNWSVCKLLQLDKNTYQLTLCKKKTLNLHQKCKYKRIMYAIPKPLIKGVENQSQKSMNYLWIFLYGDLKSNLGLITLMSISRQKLLSEQWLLTATLGQFYILFVETFSASYFHFKVLRVFIPHGFFRFLGIFFFFITNSFANLPKENSRILVVLLVQPNHFCRKLIIIFSSASNVSNRTSYISRGLVCQRLKTTWESIFSNPGKPNLKAIVRPKTGFSVNAKMMVSEIVK